jgi:putative spermidine/putrescine transport system permease protein
MLIENKYFLAIFKLFVLLILLFILAPIISIIILSFSADRLISFPVKNLTFNWYESYFNSKVWLTATLYSFKIGFLTAILTTILGTLAAYSLIRGNFKGKDVVYIFLITPMIVPPMILAIALYFFFVELKLIGNIATIVIGHTIITLPLVLVSVSSSLQGINENLEKASMSLGASRVESLFRVTFPLILPGIISGALFSFLLSIDELLFPMFLGGVHITTLPTQIWGSLNYQVDPTISAVSTLIILLILFILFFIGIITNKKG